MKILRWMNKHKILTWGLVLTIWTFGRLTLIDIDDYYTYGLSFSIVFWGGCILIWIYSGIKWLVRKAWFDEKNA